MSFGNDIVFETKYVATGLLALESTCYIEKYTVMGKVYSIPSAIVQYIMLAVC